MQCQWLLSSFLSFNAQNLCITISDTANWIFQCFQVKDLQSYARTLWVEHHMEFDWTGAINSCLPLIRWTLKHARLYYEEHCTLVCTSNDVIRINTARIIESKTLVYTVFSILLFDIFKFTTMYRTRTIGFQKHLAKLKKSNIITCSSSWMAVHTCEL